MACVPYDQNVGRRGVIRRAVQEFMRRSGEFLDQTERYAVMFDADGLGVHIGIRSIRARQVLQSLPDSVFRCFQPHAFWYGDDGVVWARFGYV